MNWILIVLVHCGMYCGDGDNPMAVTNIPGYTTKQECEAAGKEAQDLTRATVKSTRFVCISQRGKI